MTYLLFPRDSARELYVLSFWICLFSALVVLANKIMNNSNLVNVCTGALSYVLINAGAIHIAKMTYVYEFWELKPSLPVYIVESLPLYALLGATSGLLLLSVAAFVAYHVLLCHIESPRLDG